AARACVGADASEADPARDSRYAWQRCDRSACGMRQCCRGRAVAETPSTPCNSARSDRAWFPPGAPAQARLASVSAANVLREPSLRQGKPWEGEWNVEPETFRRHPEGSTPSRQRRSPPAGSESCVGDGNIAREA